MTRSPAADTPRSPLRRWLLVVAHVAVAGVSAVLSWDFGRRVGGGVLGAVLALNAAVFSSVTLDAVIDRLQRPKAPPRQR